MPIRINLLAEAQALEEMRRRDPVKRAIWIGAGLAVMLLIYEGSIELKCFQLKSQLANLKASQSSHKAAYDKAEAEHQQELEVERKLGLLVRLATNRFLNGTFLDSLEHATVDNVQLQKLIVKQNFEPIAGTDKTNAGKVVLGKPAIARETMAMEISAKAIAPNTSASPSDTVRAFKEAVSTNAFFANWRRTNQFKDTGYSTETTEPSPDGRRSYTFTLSCEVKTDRPEREEKGK